MPPLTYNPSNRTMSPANNDFFSERVAAGEFALSQGDRNTGYNGGRVSIVRLFLGLKPRYRKARFILASFKVVRC